MKKTQIIPLLFFVVNDCFSHTHPYLSFTSGSISNDDCIINWNSAGSTTYKTDKYPYWIVDATKFIF